MNINNMKRSDFEELPIIEEDLSLNFNSIVLLPSSIKHDSGYNYYTVIVCDNEKPIGKLSMYDTFRFDKIDGCIIDCLAKSRLMRIVFLRNKYRINSIFHSLEEF